jgi:nitroreductase
MSNTAPSDYPLTPVLAERWSPRAFLDKPVETAKLLSVLEAARWAASSSGLQPWAFIVATKDEPEEFAKLLRVLVPFNQGWASSAPVLLLSLAVAVNAEGKENKYAHHDVGAAAAQLTIQATALGLQAHQMGGFDPEKAKEVFALPDGVVPAAAIALGYEGDSSTLPEFLAARETAARVRKPLSEFVFSGAYGTVSPLVAG